MPAEPDPISATLSAQYLALYRATLQQAAGGAELLMGKMIAGARLVLQTSEAAARDPQLRATLAESAVQLRKSESNLCAAYPQALLATFTNAEGDKRGATNASPELQFEQLELMDEGDVMTSVVVARTQQAVMLTVEASLAEFNTLICRTRGLATVRPESNPLRPEVYLDALKAVLEQTAIQASTRMDWLGAMGLTLGQELNSLYVSLSRELKTQGVIGAGYAVKHSPQPAGVSRSMTPSQGGADGAASEATSLPMIEPLRETDATLLTLDKLRRLLQGELPSDAPNARLKNFARQFAREFEADAASVTAPDTAFSATVPAALEALTEMKQVAQVVQNLERRRGLPHNQMRAMEGSIEAIRQDLRSHANGIAQLLSLEVVSLMLDNMVRDSRLLPPVQKLLRNLEPALLRLALVDPRFFTDKQHPARALLQEITHHSLAYPTEQASGFANFMQLVQQALVPLADAAIESSEPFGQALQQLHVFWSTDEKQMRYDRQEAIDALRHAEARNVLALTIARQIIAKPDAARVPSVVIDFLCGPWSQVIAQARIVSGAGSAVAQQYRSLVSALLWSVHPDLAHKDTVKLTRLIPLLLGTLREGLASIDYPGTRTSAFFESLMGLHQLAFRTAKEAAAALPGVPIVPSDWPTLPNVVGDDPWVAPVEARISGLIELPGVDANAPMAADDLPLGSWVELQVNDEWVRTQLIWASPQSTLFLFTSAMGATQSMTRRSRDKLIANGKLRVVADRPMLEGALDAVAQLALKNSVNSTY